MNNQKKTMNKPIAVLISDVHYNINTLDVADKAMRLAIGKANELDLPLVVAGDLHDTKANLRGECINAMIKTFSLCKLQPYVIVGNHCKINEKSKEHSLSFLQELAGIVNSPRKHSVVLYEEYDLGYLIPYHHDVEELRAYLKTIPKGSRLIMHQGLTNSNSGHYIQDKSALNKEDVEDFRVISGHYHTRQDIKTGRPQKGAVGLWSYLGNPYTLNYAEAKDPEKGFHVLYNDGTLEFIPTKLRKHVIIEHDLDTKESNWFRGPIIMDGKVNDLVWVKITGTREDLSKINKDAWLKEHGIPRNVKFDLIPNETKADIDIKSTSQSQPELLDTIIGSMTNVSDEQKERIKIVWKDLCES